MINQLRKQNLLLIEQFEKSGNLKLLTKHKIIEQLLKYDDCFERLSIEKSADILKSLGIDDWKKAYVKLITK